jgi:hypothetical protein
MLKTRGWDAVVRTRRRTRRAASAFRAGRRVDRAGLDGHLQPGIVRNREAYHLKYDAAIKRGLSGVAFGESERGTISTSQVSNESLGMSTVISGPTGD